MLDNVRSAFNVGSMFRTAEAARVSHVHLCGITPHPPHPQLDRTALGTAFRVPWTHHRHSRDAIAALRSEGVRIHAVEITPEARSLRETPLPRPGALVFGHEVGGVDPELLELADEVIHVPMWGRKNSLNVAVVFGIVVFDTIGRWGY